MFQLEDVSVSYGRNLALRTEQLAFGRGEAVALMGPNGAGKTTLLSLLAGLLAPTKGALTNGAAQPATPPSVSYVAQETQQLVSFTVSEIIRMGRYRERGLLGRLRRNDRELLNAVAERLRINDFLHKPFGELSGGQRQRVRVAAALANDADCLLLDEPVTGLDLPSQETIFEVVRSERSAGRLVMMSTHNVDEARRCDRVLLLNTLVIADGTPTEVLTEENLRGAFGERLVSVLPTGDPSVFPELALVDGHGHE